MISLKPCPFCNSSDITHVVLDSGVNWLECEDCCVTIGGSCNRNNPDDLADDWNKRDTSAIEAAVLRRVADELSKGHVCLCESDYFLREEADRIEKGV